MLHHVILVRFSSKNLSIAYFTKVQLMIQSVNTSIILCFVWLIADFIQIPESHFVRVHLTARTLETTSSHCYHMCVWKEVVVFLQRSGRGSNPGPLASEEDALSTPPSHHLAKLFSCCWQANLPLTLSVRPFL